MKGKFNAFPANLSQSIAVLKKKTATKTVFKIL